VIVRDIDDFDVPAVDGEVRANVVEGGVYAFYQFLFL
jgi:hypothetical protein